MMRMQINADNFYGRLLGADMDIQAYISERQARVAVALEQTLATASPAPSLQAAMRYAVLNGGKRLRPLLAYASAEALGAETAAADVAAVAVELMHAYSLVHDDLPAMDDDDLRRGQPSCHIRFGEATAILAGDALQTLAFELLAVSGELQVSAQQRLQMLGELSRASGWQGMVAGQSIDIEAAGEMLDEKGLARMHSLKTGALIAASIKLGALSSGCAEAVQLQQLEIYAKALGLAFQIQDDILDEESDTATLGKQQGQDRARHKPTYPAILGLEQARNQAQALCEEGIAALQDFGSRAQALEALARYIIQRRH